MVLANNGGYQADNEEICVSLRDFMIHAQRDNLKELCAVETHVANRGPSSYGFHIAKVQVDTETGAVKVIDYTAVQDVGFLINPMALEGQLAGAIHMGLGYARRESLD